MNMLDTVKLQLKKPDFEIFKKFMFYPDAQIIYDSFSPYRKSINNPTKTDKKQGIYLPRLTLIKRAREFYLTIEFSVQKIVFNENVSEVDEDMFDEVIERLKVKLWQMGVKVEIDKLSNADLLAFHPAKNIQLKDGYTSKAVIDELSKVKVDDRLDFTKVKYTRGCSLYFYSKAHSFVVYDKITEFKRPMCRAIDKDKTKRQLDIYNVIKEKQEYYEILRLEVRLCTKKKARTMLEKVGYMDKIIFKKIFNKDLCQRLVYYYWSKFITMNSLFVFDIEDNPQKIYQRLRRTYPDMKARKVIYLYGLSFICKDNDGVKGFRDILTKKEWQSISKDFKYLERIIKDIQPIVKHIDDELLEFAQFTYKEVINDKKLST
jgi:hypothetical protein